MKTEKQNQTEKRILVLEDMLDNRIVALLALEEYGKVQVPGTLEMGYKLLDEYQPHIAFVDLHFPRKAGEEPEKLGHEFAKELEKRAIPYAIVTAGYHHDKPITRIICAGQEKTTTPKHQPETWKEAYQILVESVPNLDEIIKSRERYQKFTGKPYPGGKPK